MQTQLINTCLFLVPALTFAFPGAYWLGALVLSVLGIASIIRKPIEPNELRSALKDLPLIWGFLTYSVIHGVLTLYHDEPAKDFGNILPFLLFPLMVPALLRSKPKPTFFWMGCASGALLAFMIAGVQVYVLGVGRAFGFRNPITFGDTAVVLGTAALIGLFFCRSLFKTILAQAYLMIGGIAGLITSLLSGSKGGWLSLVMVAFLLASAATRSMHLTKRIGIVLSVFAALIAFVFLMPKLPVVERIVSAYNGTKVWLATGDITEGSASIRLEAFKAGLIAGLHSPLMGLGRQGELDTVRNAVIEGKVHKDMLEVKVIDNDFISVFSKQGILGVLGVIAFHVGVFLTFWKYRRNASESVRAIASMGVLLVLLYVEFGLSISIFGTNIFRTVYAAWATILAGLLLIELERNQQVNTAPLGRDLS